MHRFHQCILEFWIVRLHHTLHCMTNTDPNWNKLKVLSKLVEIQVIFHTWLLFDACRRLNLSIFNFDIGIRMGIVDVRFARAISCIWVVFKVAIMVEPKWSKIFENIIHIKFFDVNLIINLQVHEVFLFGTVFL